jgi:hypothetical protein
VIKTQIIAEALQTPNQQSSSPDEFQLMPQMFYRLSPLMKTLVSLESIRLLEMLPTVLVGPPKPRLNNFHLQQTPIQPLQAIFNGEKLHQSLARHIAATGFPRNHSGLILFDIILNGDAIPRGDWAASPSKYLGQRFANHLGITQRSEIARHVS